MVFGLLFWHQNAAARTQLHAAQQEDMSGKTTLAKTTLSHISGFLVLHTTRQQIKAEVQHNQVLVDTASKIAQAQQLLKEHKTAQALALLNSLPKSTGNSSSQSQTAQVNALKSTIQQSTKGSSSSSPNSSHSSSGGGGTTSSGGGSGSSGSGSGGSSGGSGGGGSGGSTPPPPGPMSTITLSSFSVSASARNATTCNISQSVNFTTNGTGNVSVTWKVLSTKTSSWTDNPDSFSFSAAGTQTDARTDSAQGLESGDSYRVSVTVVDQANGAVIATAGPTTVGTCAAPQSLLAAQQPSNMTSITPGAISPSQNQDGIFSNECSMAFTTPLTVNGSGSVQAVYTITSGSSGGATLYAISTEDFTGAGSANDQSYIRMPHLNSGDVYSISARLIDVGNQSVYGTSGTVTSGCS